ncbi:MAG: hypothetical protein HFJ37_01730 [Clostridia bacterium]|nr:hypothetical protein [Clostridia bacterium]
MNLMEESFQNKEEKKKKRTSTIILGAIIFLVIAIVALTAYLLYIQSSTLRLALNGQQNEKLKQILILEKDGTVYIPIKEVAGYFGYESYSGEYTNRSEDPSKCYVQNEKEVANFTLGSNKVYKLDLSNSSENYEYIYAKKPVKAINGVLYATSEIIEKAFNLSFQYNQEKNRINIYTMPYLIQVYTKKALDYGYTQISDVFANQKTILQDMIVVKKSDTQYGVIDTEGNVILEPKYNNITYLPNVGDFLVENNKKVGILSKNKETKVQIMYDSIELMDYDAGLYVAKKDNKYGVLDFRGNVKIYIENDEVGMDISNFTQNNIKNKYILAGNLIPVRKGKLWGLFDKNGRQVVDFQYDSLGYIASSNKDALNLLVIPDYNVMVACKDDKYTLLSSTGKELFIAPVADDIYMTISGEQKHYYITANNGKMDAEEYLDNIGVSKTRTDLTDNNQTNSNSDEIEEKNKMQEVENMVKELESNYTSEEMELPDPVNY